MNQIDLKQRRQLDAKIQKKLAKAGKNIQKAEKETLDVLQKKAEK